MMDQKPSVGRIVFTKIAGQIRPAIITVVWSETCVNLHVFGEPIEGVDQGMYPTSVTRFPDCGAERSWDWPPRV